MKFTLPAVFKISVQISSESVLQIQIPDDCQDAEREYKLPGTDLAVWISHQQIEAGWRMLVQLRNHGVAAIQVEAVNLEWQISGTQGQPDWRVLIDAGECAWCGVKKLSALEWSPAFDVIAEQRIKEPEARSGKYHRSSLQTVIYDLAEPFAMLIGFLRQERGYNGIDVIPVERKPEHLACIRAWQLNGAHLQPGENLDLDPLICLAGTEPLDLLERFSSSVHQYHGRNLDHPPIVGMMTWYGYRTAINQQLVLENAALTADLFNGYPQPMQKLMLLDHGWQPDANWGYWQESDPERFPHGMQWLGEQLNQLGLQLGLWYTPFCVTENSTNFDELNPWLVRGNDGNPSVSYACVWGQLAGHSAGNWPIYFLDGSLPEVQDKWTREFKKMSQEWRSVYFKLDFFALLAGAERAAEYPTGKLYQQTYQTFRRAAGDLAHLAPCSCDTNIQLGYNDSVRIAADIGNAGTWPGELPQYRSAFSTLATLWYKHRRFWINDADSIQVGCGSGLNEGRVRATAVALTGGHLMISEDLRWMSAERIEMVRRLLPVYGKAARPIDLFEHVYPDDLPHIWSLSVDSDWGAGNTLAVFNLDEKPLQMEILPEWLDMPSQQEYGVVEWWQQRWIGRFQGPFKIWVPAADVFVLHAQPYREYPWLISISQPITGGWTVENLHFRHATGQLCGEVVTKPGLALTLTGTLPAGWVIPPNADYHGRSNGAGGWAHELITTVERTPFAIQFARRM